MLKFWQTWEQGFLNVNVPLFIRRNKTDVHFLLLCLSLDHTCLDLPSLTSKNTFFSFVRDSNLSISSITYCYISEYKLFKSFSMVWKWNNLTRFFGARLVALVVEWEILSPVRSGYKHDKVKTMLEVMTSVLRNVLLSRSRVEAISRSLEGAILILLVLRLFLIATHQMTCLWR